MRFLVNGVELLEQFSLRYLAMKLFKELSANVLKRPMKDSVNSTILDASNLAAVRRCVEWLVCQVTKSRMWDSTLGSSVYRGYG